MHMVGKLTSASILIVAVCLLGVLVTVGSGLALCGDGSGPPDATWERLQNGSPLVIGVDPDIPPFGMHGAGPPQGIDPDLGTALAAEMGVPLRLQLVNFDGMFDKLYRGEVDVVIAALRPDLRRVDRFRYTQSYFDAGQIFVGLQKPLPDDLESLSGVTLAVEFASDGDVAARAAIEDGADFTLERLYTIDNIVNAVLNGQVDYALLDTISARLAVRDNPDLVVGQHTIVPDPYVIAVRRGDWRLFIAIESALEKLHDSGELDTIIARWL